MNDTGNVALQNQLKKIEQKSGKDERIENTELRKQNYF